MHSLRSGITLLTVCVTIAAVAIIAAISVLFIIRSEQREGEQTLLLMAETGERNLDYYFNSVEKSIGRVADFAGDDLSAMEEGDFGGHVERVRDFFDEVAHKTNGVKTYYYRIDPDGSIVFLFDFPNEKFRVPVRYALNGERFDASILTDGILEYGTNKIKSIEFLPYFGAGGMNEDGYLFVPDGSGALIYFNNERLTART